jgi:hypothetical protein
VYPACSCGWHAAGPDGIRGSAPHRIGTNGQELVENFDSEIEAGKALEVIAQAKRRRGYQDL